MKAVTVVFIVFALSEGVSFCIAGSGPANDSAPTSTQATTAADNANDSSSVPSVRNNSPNNIGTTETTVEAVDTHSMAEQEDSSAMDEQIKSDSTSPEFILGKPTLRPYYTLGDYNGSSGVDLRIGQCGSRGRIIGGLEAAVGAWPWAVVLKDNVNVQYCGGVLISSRHVLTAAHCIEHPDLVPRLPLKATVGEHDVSRSDESNSQTEWIAKALTHTHYNRPTNFNNDISVLVLQNPVDESRDNVAPACLPAENLDLSAGAKLFVVGWGATMTGGPSVNVLRQVQVTLLPHSDCAVYNEYHPDRMLCVGDPAGNKDACQGDSGGPLLHQDSTGKWFVVGIVSFGSGCGQPGFPGVYTRVKFHLSLITVGLAE